MKRKLIHPNQIIALKDYPLHNEQILKIYFRVFYKKQGKILPPCPVVHKSIGIPYLPGKNKKSKTYNTSLKRFLKKHPHAEYFLLDGNHKSVAAALAREPLPVMVLEDDQDIEGARQLIDKGEIFGWYRPKNSIKESLEELAKHFLKHFSEKPSFYTVAEKAKMLVQRKAVPKYMVAAIRKKMKNK